MKKRVIFVVSLLCLICLLPFKVYAANPFSQGQCTWWAYERWTQLLGYEPQYIKGNAGGWYDNCVQAGFSRGSEPRVGAIACWNNGFGDDTGHVAIVEAVTSEYISVSEYNWSVSKGYSTANISFSNINRSSSSKPNRHLKGYIYLPGSVATGNNPEGNCEAIYGNTGSITIDGWVIDKDSKSEPIELHVYIGGPEGEGHPGIIANKYRPDVPISLNDAALGDYHGFKDTIPTKKTGNQDVYVYAINVGSGENTLLKKQTVYIEPDVTNPSITEDKVSDITNDGYTITCKVTDNVTVSRVVFCTWTEANGQDDIVEEDGVASGDTYTYRVNRSDHNNEYGNYITHIYAYDYSGNYVGIPIGAINMGYCPEGFCEAIDGNIGSVTIDGWTLDKDIKEEALQLHVYIGGPAGAGEGHPGIIADQYRPDVPEALKDNTLGEYHGFKDTIYTKKTGMQDVYVYAINVGKGDNTLLAKETVYIEPDTTKPDISNIKISDVTSDGYTITCDVEDNVTVKRVVFSTWTDSNGQDDKLEEEGTKSGNTYTYRVKRSSHNNECGDYTTHIFAYDYTGNYALSTAGTTDIGHIEVIDKGTEATCETEGRTEGKHCSACGETLKKQEVIPAKGHTVVTDKAVAATCEIEGKTEGKHCSVCDEVLKKQEVIPAKGHTVVTDKAVAATCGTAGKTEGSHCSVCGKELKKQEVIPAKGHFFDDGVIEKPATQYEEGLKVYTCSNCGLTRTEVIAKLPVTEQEKPSNPGAGDAEKTEPEKPKAEQPKREEAKSTENKVPVGSVLVEEKTGGVYKVLRVSGGTGEVQYMKPTGTSSTAVVPDTVTINGISYRVTEICDNAFKGNKNLRKVVIGRYVKRIGKNAFANCKRLQSVTMGSAVTVIDDKAFFKCTSLKKITIPGQIVKIGKKAFFGAKKLKTITIKTKKLTMKTVGSKAFKGIYAKAKIKVPKAKKKLYRNVLRKRGVSGRAVIK